MMEIKVLDKGFVRLVDHMGTDESVVEAARVSYAGAPRKTVREDRALIRYLMKHRHTSPFEMCELKFHCKMPIFIARQWVRHRTASLNEISGRYSILKEEFYIPQDSDIKYQSKSNNQGTSDVIHPDSDLFIEAVKDISKNAFYEYNESCLRDIARETARIVLPLNTYTEWYWKMDLHNLFHFLQLRMDKHAQREIREYADAIFQIVKDKFPICAEAFEDYVLNSVTFSAEEIGLLKQLIDIPFFEGILNEPDAAEKLNMTKREIIEFKEKFIKINV